MVGGKGDFARVYDRMVKGAEAGRKKSNKKVARLIKMIILTGNQ
jgi:hypothetical protein